MFGADVPISSLPAASSVTGSDVVPIVQSGTTKKSTFTVQKGLWDSFYQPLDGDLTALSALSGTHTIYYRSAASTWSAVTIGNGLNFTGATLAVNTPTPTPTATATATPTPTATATPTATPTPTPTPIADVSDAAYDASWNAVTTFAPSKNAVYDKIETTIGTVKAHGRVTAQSSDVSVATFTNGGSDATFTVSMNMNVTAAVAISTSMNCVYNDESGTERIMIFPVTSLAGNFLTNGLIVTTGAFETPVMHIRVQASSVIELYTAGGTFTTVTYTAEGIITQMP